MGYISVEPIIENTTMEKYVNSNGVERTYVIAPIDGYVLHDSRKDFTRLDENDEEILLEGFGRGSVSVPISYDFVVNPFNLYTKLVSEVPADQIFGGGTTQPEHEVM